MIDVAGLGVGIVRPPEIVAALLRTEIAQPVASSSPSMSLKVKALLSGIGC
jgi:hypothetical protein